MRVLLAGATGAVVTAVVVLALLVAGPVGANTGVPAAGSSAPDGACAWPVRDSADLVNVAFPDESAHYWGTVASGIPETGVVVRGRYPRARYFSLQTYSASLAAYDVLTDREIEPSRGRNPFVKPGRLDRRPHRGGRWEVRIFPGEAPAKPRSNTMYTGSTRGAPNLAATVLYRIYTPDDPSDPEGGVGLPTVNPVAEDAEGPVLAGCSITPLLPETGFNELVQQTNWPDGATVPTRNVTDPPTWKKFFGFGSAIADQLGASQLGPTVDGALGDGGFFNNLDNSYMTATIGRDLGGVVVLRAKMPTFPDTRAGEPAWRRSQVRYWSICQNHPTTQRYVDCLADHDSVLDGRRRATFVISDPEDRPRNAVRRQGVNWLPWGGIYSSGVLIYRQLVPASHFKRALADVERGDPLKPALGPYLPTIAYCTTQRFARSGPSGCLSRH